MMMIRLFLSCLALLGFCSCESMDKDTFFLSVHSQGMDNDNPRSVMPDLVGNPPQKVILNRVPEFSQSQIAAVQSFPADNGNGNGVALKLDFKGTQALEMATRMRQGEILRTLVNGRGVDYVRVDRPISDGIFVVWQGVPDEVVEEMKKKYPPISSLRSSASNQEMTPSTKSEKKKSMSRYRDSEREDTKETAEAEREAAAGVEAPAVGGYNPY